MMSSLNAGGDVPSRRQRRDQDASHGPRDTAPRAPPSKADGGGIPAVESIVGAMSTSDTTSSTSTRRVWWGRRISSGTRISSL